MRTVPNMNDKYDANEVKTLKAQDWQLKALEMNPSYVFWGNHEDYMWKKDTSGWDRPLEFETIADLFTLDEYNELVNFYFFIHRKNHVCPACEGENLNPATKQLSDDWYDFAGTGRRWDNKITEVEIEALVKGGRLTDLMDKWYRFDDETNTWVTLDQSLPYEERKWEPCDAPVMPTPEQVNGWASGRGIGHDAINRWICVEARAKHQGVFGHCDECEGGYIYDEPDAKLGLQMWILHPRKGASRGVIINDVKQDELPKVVEYLKGAAERNAERFSKLK